MTLHHEDIKNKGLAIIISSPSGGGKTSLTKALIENDTSLKLAVSATTRAPRPGEKEGVDYYFLSQEEFLQKLSHGAFLESATVFDNSYGTLKETTANDLAKGIDVIFNIDWQGTQIIAPKLNADTIKIFIIPPSLSELLKRLQSRKQDSAEIINKRMQKAISEIAHYNEYDYVVINDDFNDALEKLKTIIKAHRLKRTNQANLDTFIANEFLNQSRTV